MQFFYLLSQFGTEVQRPYQSHGIDGKVWIDSDLLLAKHLLLKAPSILLGLWS